MKPGKRIIVLLVILALIAAILSSCATTPISSSTLTSTSAESTSTALASISAIIPSTNPTEQPAIQPNATQTPSATKSIVQTSQPKIQNAQIKLISITSPINKGQTATITIQGTPNTNYSITVYYKSGASTAAGLIDKTSDSSGKVSWSWKVGTRTTNGTWDVDISGGGQSLTAHFTVE